MSETKFDDFDAAVKWCNELADAMKNVEAIAAKGGAYGLAHRARKLADTLRIAQTVDAGVTAANATNLAE
jgi:hypothetical protein